MIRASVLDPQQSYQELKEYFLKQGSALIAYSGGVDSALLAWVAYQALGANMLAVLADSSSLSRREYHAALDFSKKHGFPIEIIRPQEMQNESYRKNEGDRCYYCKSSLFEKLEELQACIKPKLEGSWEIYYGVNLDDLGDYRPGLKAAKEYDVCSPYLILKWEKDKIRNLAHHLNLSIAEKPSMPCLASRIPHGYEVNEEKLRQIEKAEAYLQDLGFRTFRVRHHKEVARIELGEKEWNNIVGYRDKINQAFKEIGFDFVSIDLQGFYSGSLNRVLT